MATLKYAKKGVGFVSEVHRDVAAAMAATLLHTDLDESHPVTIVGGGTVICETRESLIVLSSDDKPKEKPKGKKKKD